MLVPFNTLLDESRIWIYPSSRSFDENTLKEIRQKTNDFLSQWKSHQQTLNVGVAFPYNQFIVIGVDEGGAKPSGCAIDSSIRFIQRLEENYKVKLLDKMNVTFRKGKDILYKSLANFILMAKNNRVSKNTIVFNNLVSTKKEYETQWEVPAEKSWHYRYFK